MDEDIATRVYADPLARWFVTEAYRITDTAELVAALVEGGGRLDADPMAGEVDEEVEPRGGDVLDPVPVGVPRVGPGACCSA